MYAIISVVLNTNIAASEYCNFPSMSSIFYSYNFFSKVPFTINADFQTYHAIGLEISILRPTTSSITQ